VSAANARENEIERAAPIAAPPSKNSSSCLRDQNLWAEPVTTTANRESHMTATAELRGLVTVEVAFTVLTSERESPTDRGASSLCTTGRLRKWNHQNCRRLRESR
jgi:hypothetical protein